MWRFASLGLCGYGLVWVCVDAVSCCVGSIGFGSILDRFPLPSMLNDIQLSPPPAPCAYAHTCSPPRPPAPRSLPLSLPVCRACHNAGMGDTASELIDDLQASSAVKRLEQYMPPSSLSPSSSQATDVADVTDASDATQAGLDERGINGDVGGGEGGGGEE